MRNLSTGKPPNEGRRRTIGQGGLPTRMGRSRQGIQGSMSQKWVRAKQWDDRNLPAAFEPARYWVRRFGAAAFWGGLLGLGAAYAAVWMFLLAPLAAERPWLNPWVLPFAVVLYLVWPVKFVLRALSSIPTAVVLLSLVALYGVLASIPIGLVAKIPTVIIYGATVLTTIGVVAVVPTWLTTRAMRGAGAGRAARFVVGFLGFQVLALGAVWLWYHFAWPSLRYDAVTQSGLLLFPDFVHRNASITLRRLPGLEMSELEFYGWWPLKVILLLFVVNMVTATVRRIEFSFPNIGVLTVHTGIVTIALGSVYYQKLKVEGDMLLLAGVPDERGNPVEGPVEGGFYDNTEVVIWVSQGGTRRPEQRLLDGLPRYNDYNLNALGLVGFEEAARELDEGKTLDLQPRSLLRPGSVIEPGIDPDLDVRVVGYANYAELRKRAVPAPAPADAAKAQPARQVVVLSALPPGFVPGSGPLPAPVEPRTVLSADLFPAQASKRVLARESIAIEATRGLSDARWNELKTPLPPLGGHGGLHGLIVDVPGLGGGGGAPGLRKVYAVDEGTRLSVGTTGYTLEVVSLAARPPFPLVTPGYEGASSSLAIVRVTPPSLADGTLPPAYERWVYSRFPEISQDMLGEAGANGMPRRRAADPGIRITYVDASIVQVYFDERVGTGTAEDPMVRALVRLPGRPAAEIEGMRTGERVQIDEMVFVGLGARVANTVEVEFPLPTPEDQRDKQGIGTHAKAAIAVQLRSRNEQSWSRTVWVPFSKYVGVDQSLERSVTLPDGRRVGFMFGRRRQTLPKMALKLTSFDMIPYEHSDIPRDYRSDVAVVSWSGGAMKEERRYTSLNEPLLVRVPFERNEKAPGIANAIGWVMARIAPDSYKFSQAGWDSEGWTQTKAAAAGGRFDRPSARFTILGVGNNPGITIIAAGAVMMSLGIPWAFYLKPAIMRGRKRRLQRELAAKASGATSNGTDAQGLARERETRIGAETGS